MALTAQYLSLRGNNWIGAAPASAASAWGFGSWVSISTMLTTESIYISGFTFQIEYVPANDTTIQMLFEVATGLAGSESTIIQIPYSFRRDSNVGYYHTKTFDIFLPEMVYVAAGNRLAVRVTDSVASAITYTAVKLMYKVSESPVVVPDSPANATTTADVTPGVRFTGTDTQSDTIEYKTQIISTYGTIEADSYPSSNAEIGAYLNVQVQPSVGQSFTGNGNILYGCAFYLAKDSAGVTIGNFYAKVWTHSGTYGSTSLPGTLLATSDGSDASTLPNWPSPVVRGLTFSGPNQILLENGVNYVLTIHYDAGSGADRMVVANRQTSPTHAGNYVWTADGFSFTAYSTWDLIFYVNTYDASVTLEKYSESDSGYANITNSGNTHPFPSGEQIEYTVQSGDSLPPGIYYWRVAGKDPSGSNTYGAWSTTRTLYVSGAKAWNGSSWQYKPVKVWDGSGWVTKTVKVWDGSGWVIK